MPQILFARDKILRFCSEKPHFLEKPVDTQSQTLFNEVADANGSRTVLLKSCDCTDKGKPVVRQGLQSRESPKLFNGFIPGTGAEIVWLPKAIGLRLALISVRRTPSCVDFEARFHPSMAV
jgi:hypothetical protein